MGHCISNSENEQHLDNVTVDEILKGCEREKDALKIVELDIIVVTHDDWG